MQSLAAAIAGIEHLLKVREDRHDDVVVRQRAMAQVVDRADLAVGLDDPLGEVGKLLFEAKIGGHGPTLRFENTKDDKRQGRSGNFGRARSRRPISRFNAHAPSRPVKPGRYSHIET